ncbi:Uncharacterized conserved protein, DUF1697 family [Paenibacillus sp. UNCCL117]|uniref:DUF1697 domain-containing protein n=1 Tax=unclassified Paenibacillus TaxID=185978 RepID=UPI000881FD59|nr:MULTISPECIES: DUF1697 domain-containing protein [unclassified Paenibacillus]SDD12451.1 Uncharacterized conserved protein, DUF1697 family [Paenibacillus sp. cl123]SFW33789.1 Uncharacterized conserved protein, DUF1697 family [Paenibacillus sp. UNCCL117]
MPIHVALLRGINVSGQKLIKMAELKRMFEAMGLERVQTYIQSGNVLFASAAEEEAQEPLHVRIEREIERVFGFQVPVVVRTIRDLERVIGQCPFPADSLAEGESLYVALLTQPPTEEGIQRLLACSRETDEYRLARDEVYILCRQGLGKSMFSNNFLEKKLKVAATTRNWQTMNKLAALGRALELEASSALPPGI